MSDDLLLEATRKLIELTRKLEWSQQLLHRAPPVLWFGNRHSSKPKVLTLGANPSRSEFLESNQKETITKAVETGDQSKLTYLSKPRFRVLRADEVSEDILSSHLLRAEILGSYDSYFFNNPYNWFGHNRDSSYKVEGFLRGLGASFFEPNMHEKSALHIDLFPFTTLHDFNTISATVAPDLFDGGWARRFLSNLVQLLKPDLVVVFGKANVEYFCRYVNCSDENSISWRGYAAVSSRFTIFDSKSINLPVVGLSTNLGNPLGFNVASLKAYGLFIKDQLQSR